MKILVSLYGYTVKVAMGAVGVAGGSMDIHELDAVAVQGGDREGFVREAIRSAGIVDEACEILVAEALREVPREIFCEQPEVPARGRGLVLQRGYEDRALRARGGGMVERAALIARIAGVVAVQPGDRVLEIEPRSGYSAAVFSSCGCRVFSVAGDAGVNQARRKILDAAGFPDVVVHNGSARTGWSEFAPYDVIICWGQLEGIEIDLLQQLSEQGGRLVAFVPHRGTSALTLMRRAEGRFSIATFEGCERWFAADEAW